MQRIETPPLTPTFPNRPESPVEEFDAAHIRTVAVLADAMASPAVPRERIAQNLIASFNEDESLEYMNARLARLEQCYRLLAQADKYRSKALVLPPSGEMQQMVREECLQIMHQGVYGSTAESARLAVENAMKFDLGALTQMLAFDAFATTGFALAMTGVGVATTTGVAYCAASASSALATHTTAGKAQAAAWGLGGMGVFTAGFAAGGLLAQSFAFGVAASAESRRQYYTNLHGKHLLYCEMLTNRRYRPAENMHLPGVPAVRYPMRLPNGVVVRRAPSFLATI